VCYGGPGLPIGAAGQSRGARKAAVITWTRILAPLLGVANDETMLRAATALAAPFDAHMAGEFVASTPNSLLPWMTDGGLNGPEMAVASIQKSALDGEGDARARVGAIG
jgi:hypothetical protein